MNNIKFDTDTIIPGVCAYCGHAFDTCAGDGIPDVGNLTLCIRCAGIHVFDEKLNVVKADIETINSAMEDEDIKRLVKIINHSNKIEGKA